MATLPGDSLTLKGAREIANKIQAYWIKRGYPAIQTTIESFRPMNLDGTRCKVRVYQVRTNLGPNGYPPCSPGT